MQGLQNLGDTIYQGTGTPGYRHARAPPECYAPVSRMPDLSLRQWRASNTSATTSYLPKEGIT